MKKLAAFITGFILIAVVAGLNNVGAHEGEHKVYKDAHELVDALKPGVNMIDKTQLKKMISSDQDFYLIDIRESIEYKAGNIKGSILIPRGILEFKIFEKVKEMLKKDLKKTDAIVLYCKKGDRSVLSADNLQKLGFTNVMALEGGWLEWSGKNKKATKKATKKSSKKQKPRREGC